MERGATSRRGGWLIAGLAAAVLILAQTASAALTVRVQPSGESFANAYTLQGEMRTLFGNAEGGTGALDYKWEFSDGGSTAFAAVADASFISIDHTFGTAGDHWARLTVQDSTSAQASATIFLKVVAADSLNRQKNSAVDRGLRYMYRAKSDCGGSGRYFSNSGPSEAYIYGYTEGTTAWMYYAYYFGATACPGTFTVDWGDGTVETYPGYDWYCGYPYAYVADLSHVYAASGSYTIQVSHDGTAANPFITVGISVGSAEVACWPGSGQWVGSTSMALVAFENHGHNLQSPDSDIYKRSVRGGVQFLLNTAGQQPLNDQTCIGNPEAGDADGEADGFGLAFSGSTYEYSLASLALANSCDEAFAKGMAVSVPGAATLWDVGVDAKDYLAWAQAEGRACADGNGWRYGANSWDSDNSVTQWPILALDELDARWGITVKPEVVTQADRWLAYSQLQPAEGGDGGFGYTDPWGWRNFAKTGAGLAMLHYVGVPNADPRMQDALAFLNNNWDLPAGWDGNLGHLYAMYAFFKGMKYINEATLGGRNWEELYTAFLVANQQANNTWSDWYGWFDGNFSTYAAMAILAPAVAGLPPVADAGGPYGPVNAGQSVLLDGTASYHQDSARSLAKYEWDFHAGDGLWWDTKAAPDPGEGALGQTASTSYADTGSDATYVVTLRVTDNGSPVQTDTDTSTVQVTSGDVPPVPVTNGPWTGLPGTAIVFDGSASYDPNACTTPGDPVCLGDSIVLYEWDLNGDGTFNGAADGTAVAADRSVVSKAFDEPGSGQATLCVTDENGHRACSLAQFNVYSIALVYGQQYDICWKRKLDRFREVQGIRVKFKNLGTTAAENLVMTLTSTPTNIPVYSGFNTANLGTLAPGAEVFTACNATSQTADIQLLLDRRVAPTGSWLWRAEFDILGTNHYVVNNIPPLGP